MINSQISGFYRLSVAERRARIAEMTGLTPQQVAVLSGLDGLDESQADRMVENALGVIGLPLGLCVNLRVNEQDVLVPMAVEEPSVIAACSFAAKLLRAGGGLTCEVSEPIMIGQIQVLEVPDFDAATEAVLGAKDELLALADSKHKKLLAAGGGARDLEVHRLPKTGDDPLGDMLVVHLVVDVRDAMGANAINSMCERLAPRIEALTGGRVGLRILSNLTDRRTVTVKGRVPFKALDRNGVDGAIVAARIEEASVFAERCPYRAATHNKGILNGIDAVLLAFGQDWRAVEAGAHAYAAKDGRYTAMARWRVKDGHLHGEMTVPLAVGTVGGVAKVHPTVQVTRSIARVEDAKTLAAIVAASGLAQNLAAIRALAAEGIQSGHMRLHARNVAVEAGALAHEVAPVADAIADAGTVNLDGAKDALEKLRNDSEAPPDNVLPLRPAPSDVTSRFEGLRQRFLDEILQTIGRTTAEAGGESLEDMTAYHMKTGGKRLRALLPLLVAESLGGDPKKLIPFGAACEMLHNATLVHDDLQDGDEVRRGQPTVWKQYGIPQAINVGDAMFYYTLLLAQQLEVPVALREAAARRILVETLRVIDGQEREFMLKVDPETANGKARTSQAPVNLDDYYQMVEGKTSGLFALPMAGAAEVVGASRAVVDGLTEAARHLGVLFQIQDDVLDLYGDKGRDVRGSDIGEGKRSALVVHAFEQASPDDLNWLLETLDKDRAATTEQDVIDVMALFERTGSLRYALDELNRRRDAAVAAVEELPELKGLVAGLCDLFLAPIQPLLQDPEGLTAALIGGHRIDPNDEAFCFSILPKVSRTFTLSIEALPSDLRSAVCVSYLLCRIVDTIEDEAVLERSVRRELFDTFDRLMTDDTVPWQPFEGRCQQIQLGAGSADAELVNGSGAVFRAFRALPLAQRNGIRPHVLEMSEGMREYCERAHDEGQLRLLDLDDLERYCYFVAGTVGKLLTALFEPTVPVLPEAVRSEIRDRAVSFGLGLQLVNIVKDVAVDFTRGDIFVPVALAAEHGVELEDILTPQRRQEGLAVIRAICGRAREHLQAAAEYTVLWPTPSGVPVRQFCAVPLALALASLAEVEAGHDTLRPGRVPKISRDLVAQLFQKIMGAVDDDDALAEVLRQCGEAVDDGGSVGDVHVPQRPPVPAKAGIRAAFVSDEDEEPMTDQINPYREIEGKALVTGASGHLGANLVRRLLADGREVRVLLRHGSNNESMDGLDVERVYGDLRDRASLEKAVAGIKLVYHAAANVSTIEASERLKREIYECNVLGTRNLLDVGRAADVERTVVTGSFSAVGYHLDDPSKPATEDVVVYPFDKKLPYARTKEMVEHECLKAVAEGQDVAIATSCALLGPADYKPSRMGKTLIDFTHGRLPAYIPGGFEFVSADDLCEGHILTMHRGRKGQKYVFSTQFMTMDDIMTLFEEVTGRRRPSLKLPPGLMAGFAEVSSRFLNTFFPNAPQRFTPAAVRILRQQRKADLTKARSELGYEATSVRKAVHDAYADFARRGLWPRVRPWSAVDLVLPTRIAKKSPAAKARAPKARLPEEQIKMNRTDVERNGPPNFEESRNKRQKVRAAGLDPNYWYAVEHSKSLKTGQVIPVTFWGKTVAVYRGEDGRVRAIEDRCAHRQLPMSKGEVVGNQIVCTYHGWRYNGIGELVDVAHDTFGRGLPKCRLQHYATRERYGLIWVFFGDLDRADSTPMPEIPELEGQDKWACVPIDFTWRAHHSMIIDNVSDFTHAYLHRRFRPFEDATLTALEERGDKVYLSYKTKVGRGRISGLFVDRGKVDTNAMDLCYDYPYQWSNTDDQIKHWCFVLPIDEKHTRVFFLFYFKSFKVPYLPVTIPRQLMKPLLEVSNKVLIGPLLSEDGFAVEAEQHGYDKHYEAPIAELSPAVHAFQALTIRKWQDFLNNQAQKRAQRGFVDMPKNGSSREASA